MQQPPAEEEGEDERVRVLGTTELLYEFEELARDAQQPSASEESGSEVGLLFFRLLLLRILPVVALPGLG